MFALPAQSPQSVAEMIEVAAMCLRVAGFGAKATQLRKQARRVFPKSVAIPRDETEEEPLETAHTYLSLVGDQLKLLKPSSPARAEALVLAAKHVELELAWLDEEVARQASAEA